MCHHITCRRYRAIELIFRSSFGSGVPELWDLKTEQDLNFASKIGGLDWWPLRNIQIQDLQLRNRYICHPIRNLSVSISVKKQQKNCAISHRNRVFLQMTLIWSSKVTNGQTDYFIRFATNDFLLTFHSNCSAISQRDRVFLQMTFIWLFKVTKGQTDYSIRSATKDFLLTFHSNYSAISHSWKP